MLFKYNQNKVKQPRFIILKWEIVRLMSRNFRPNNRKYTDDARQYITLFKQTQKFWIIDNHKITNPVITLNHSNVMYWTSEILIPDILFILLLRRQSYLSLNIYGSKFNIECNHQLLWWMLCCCVSTLQSVIVHAVESITTPGKILLQNNLLWQRSFGFASNVWDSWLNVALRMCHIYLYSYLISPSVICTSSPSSNNVAQNTMPNAIFNVNQITWDV